MEKKRSQRERKVSISLDDMGNTISQLNDLHRKYEGFRDRLKIAVDDGKVVGSLLVDGGFRIDDSLDWLTACLARLNESYDRATRPRIGTAQPSDAESGDETIPESGPNTRNSGRNRQGSAEKSPRKKTQKSS